jgi:carbamoyltransferase
MQATIERRLKSWAPLIQFRKSADVCRDTAQLLAADAVIGWVQGRSEFGPRALGNRSILADPRPAENKARINDMIKKREGYRPFAPSVLEERAEEFFEAPGVSDNLMFMNMIVRVRDRWQPILGAITHIDTTARVQVVRRSTNERYWCLIDEFSHLTDVPILLNTSFNNDSEPIVDSVDDAIACFLTTDLTQLVIDDYIISKPPEVCVLVGHLVMILRESLRVTLGYKIKSGKFFKTFSIETNYGPRFGGESAEISPILFRILTHPNQGQICTICQTLGFSMDATLTAEIFRLWCKRMICLCPNDL